MKSKKSEVALGIPVVAWLQAEGWDVYQEVQPGGGGGAVADIVAIRSRIVIVIELKTSLGFDVLAQAVRWKPWAHQIYVAVPKAKATDARRIALRVFDKMEIGVLEVSEKSRAETLGYGGVESRVEEAVAPAMFRKANVQYIRDHLRPEHKTHAQAGSSRGGQYTPFKGTCERLRNHVRKDPGVLMGDAIKAIEHHYATNASARAHLARLIEQGVVKGIRSERDAKGKIRLYAGDEPRLDDHPLPMLPPGPQGSAAR